MKSSSFQTDLWLIKTLESCFQNKQETWSMMILGQHWIFSADFVFLRSSVSTSRLLGCFNSKVEDVLSSRGYMVSLNITCINVCFLSQSVHKIECFYIFLNSPLTDFVILLDLLFLSSFITSSSNCPFPFSPALRTFI